MNKPLLKRLMYELCFISYESKYRFQTVHKLTVSKN
jgi:hypothetical protein